MQQYPQFNQHRHTYSTGHYTPPSSTTPPSLTSSPTNLRQAHQPKGCGYIPAALRPTEMPAPRQRRPLTPPRSAHSSVDSQASSSFSQPKSLPVTPTDDFGSFIAPFGAVTRVVTDEWNDDFGQVTGMPTRNHWKPDSTASCCTSPTCTTVFSFMARRHHCRRCGGIYCSSHSVRAVPLDQEARFHPQGNRARACDNCWNDYTVWRTERKSRSSSLASAETAVPQSQDAFAIGIKQNQNNTHPVMVGHESVREGDWNWSTF